MSPPAPRLIDRLNSETAFRWMLALFVAALLVFSAIPIANALLGESIKDNQLWHDTGQHVLHSDEVYPERGHKFPFMYPPTAALLLAPISLLGTTGVVVFLVLGNALAWIASILLAVRLATGSWARKHLLVYLIPSLIVGVYIWSNFHIGQPSMLLLTLLLAAFLALQKKWHWLAGALVALAAAIKAFPFILIVYLLYRRYWIAAASMLLTLAFLLILLPAPFRGLSQARTDLRRWTEGMLLKYDDKGLAQRPGRSNSWKNQSIFGVANRLLRHVDADEQYAPHRARYANFADLEFATVNRLIVVGALLLGLIFILVMPRRAGRNRATDAMEFALLILLMLVVTPLAFGYLFACLLYPFTVIVYRLVRQWSRALFFSAALAVVLLALTIPWQRSAQTYGNTFLATLTLFGGLALELWRVKRQEATSAVPARPA
ncbi:MAG: glycosyltransferase family 87 protein [Chthoniobacterales bacterium]